MLGRKVRHPSFGVGTIVGVEATTKTAVSVSFPGRHEKVYRAVRRSSNRHNVGDLHLNAGAPAGCVPGLLGVH